MQITTGQQFPAFHFPTTKKHTNERRLKSVWTLVSFYLLCVWITKPYRRTKLKSFMNFYSHDPTHHPTTHINCLLNENSKVIHDCLYVIKSKHLPWIYVEFTIYEGKFILVIYLLCCGLFMQYTTHIVYTFLSFIGITIR